jgi:hypothetical protein
MHSTTSLGHVVDEEIAMDRITSAAVVEDETKQVVDSVLESAREKVDSTVSSSSRLEQWNEPRINVYRYIAALYTFVIMGMNDSAYGVSAP